MSVTITEVSILPVRRDKQIDGGISLGGGSGVSMGGGTAVSAETLSKYYTKTELDGGQLDNRYYTETEIDSFTVKLTGNQSIAGSKTFTSDLITDGSVSRSTAYVSGFAGAGYKMNYADGKYTLEVDNLSVRNTFKAYELEINEISSVNGGIIVSAANGVPYSVIGTRFYFDTDNNSNPIQFAVNDYVRAQIWTGRGTASYVGLVTNVVQSATLGSAYIDATTVSGTPWSKMKLVQIGNSSDTARQNLIYITAADTNNPYIDMLSGVSAGSFSGKQKLRIGNLTGITDAAFGGALSGIGLYADNVFLKGKMVIASGTSGYANISDKPTIPTNTNQLTDGANLGGTATWSGVGSKPARFGDAPSGAGLCMTATYMGYYDGGTWKSYIDSSGNCKFVGVAEFGTATATFGSISQSLAMVGNSIYENACDGDSSCVAINYVGYNGGTDHFRDFVVYDGKGNKQLSIVGIDSIAYFGNTGYNETDVDINGTLLVRGTSVNLSRAHTVVAPASDTTCSATGKFITGMSTSIIPKGDKIQINVSVPIHPTSVNQTYSIEIYTGSTDFVYGDGTGNLNIVDFVATVVKITTVSTIVSCTPGARIYVKVGFGGTNSVQYLGSTGTYGLGHLSVIDLL